MYETFPDQNGIFPEHAIKASTHVTSSSAMTFLNLALLNNAMINYEITALICMYVNECTTVKFCNLKTLLKGFPGGTVVKNPPANAGDMGSSPGPGRSHRLQSN